MTKERKDGVREGSRSSAVFKTGAISLVFLVIGYQAALFINRAAMLGIEAARDRPDTVYVVRHVAAAAEPAPEADASSVREPAGPGLPEGARVLRTDTLKRESAHAPLIRRVENFEFDPNSVSVEDLMRLGFSEKQALSIDNYRAKGGRFRRKSDFAKSYVVADSVYRRLESYIRIPKVDINTADSAMFDALPGIGPYFAAKMEEYRGRLGGYSFPEQLLDIYNFGEERFDGLKDLIECSEPPAYELWTLPADELRKHPYIRSRQAADAIVLYRENTPAGSLSVEGLAAAGILPEEDAARLARCRIAAHYVSGDD